MQKEAVMRTFKRAIHYLLAPAALLAVSFSATAYEVHILTGQGSESRTLDKGNYDVAIERLERRVQHETRYIDIQLTNLCTAYVTTRQLEKAEDVCDRAVEANGDYVGTAYNSRGVLKALKGDYVEALADFNRANDRSNYPIARENYGDQAPSMSRFQTVKQESDNSIELAARNHAAADRTWAAIKQEDAVAFAESPK
jgi:tetratricopeptide (TPR) repeat protein